MPINYNANINTDSLPAAICSESVYASFATDGTFMLQGGAIAWEDLRVDRQLTRAGVVAPTDEAGFRGDANHYSRGLVHNQADEVQFFVQLPRAYKVGSNLHSHVHFSPWIVGSGNNQASLF